MNNINFTFPKGLKKALTLSYDDGVYQDIKLVDIFNKHNLKCTFNLNSGIKSGTSWNCKGKDIIRMNLSETVDLYRGHEIAIHTLTHPDLVKLSKADVRKEVLEDKNNLENIYHNEIVGMAYPFGTHNEEVANELKELDVKYARTVEDTETFNLPENFLTWNPTCRHENFNLMYLADRFVKERSDGMQLFYVWGHSYEFDVNNNWELIEKFSEYISNKDDIWYVTNREIYEYITAVRSAEIFEEDKYIVNNSNLDIFVEVNGHLLIIPKGEKINY